MNIAFGSGHQTYTRIKTDLRRIIRRFNPMSGQDPVSKYFRDLPGGKYMNGFCQKKYLYCEYTGNIMVKGRGKQILFADGKSYFDKK